MKRLTLIALTLLSFAVVAMATTIRPMTVDELTTNASMVIEGHATSTWSGWDASHRFLLTWTKFTVTKSLKGGASKEVTVVQLGGTDGVLTSRVSGVRHFQVGEDALLFLRPGDNPNDGLFVVGLMQGNFRVVTTASGDRFATNGVPDTFVLHGTDVAPFAGTQIPLSVLEAQVQKAVTR